MTNVSDAESSTSRPYSSQLWLFVLLLAGLIGGAILRSSLATRIDSFTYDEPYHTGAGAAYVQTGDFRLNPEHPPLVKLWIGTFETDPTFAQSRVRVRMLGKLASAEVETDKERSACCHA